MLPGHQRINIITLGKLSPTIISDRDSYPIGVMKPQTQGVREEKGATQIVEMALQDPEEMNYGSVFLKP